MPRKQGGREGGREDMFDARDGVTFGGRKLSLRDLIKER